LADGDDVVLVASGSEVGLALDARAALAEQGIAARVVSVPCREVFMAQDEAYRLAVLPSNVPQVVVEAGVTSGWLGLGARNRSTVGINRFGESAPGDTVYAHLGMTVDHVVDAARALVGR
jgi:transketolase